MLKDKALLYVHSENMDTHGPIKITDFLKIINDTKVKANVLHRKFHTSEENLQGSESIKYLLDLVIRTQNECLCFRITDLRNMTIDISK